MDRGANGGIIEGDAEITHEHLYRVDVTGIMGTWQNKSMVLSESILRNQTTQEFLRRNMTGCTHAALAPRRRYCCS